MKRTTSSASRFEPDGNGMISVRRVSERRILHLARPLALVLVAIFAPPSPSSAAPSTVEDEGSWLDLAPPPDDEAKVDPDGHAVVYLDALDARGPAELWSLSFARDDTARLSGAMAPGDRIWAYTISPDGRWVAFTASSGDGPRRLFLAPIGGGPPTRVDDDRAPLAIPELFAFRPDSRAIGYRGGPGLAAVEVLIEALPQSRDGTPDASESRSAPSEPSAREAAATNDAPSRRDLTRDRDPAWRGDFASPVETRW